MSSEYFGHARTDVLAHLDRVPFRLLEIGCGAGATLAALRERGEVTAAMGVELDEAAAEAARAHFDVVLTGPVEGAPIETKIPPGALDAVFCLDVLEHLVDPWTQVRRLSALLGPGGQLVVSVPNIRNGKFIRNLLFKGDFAYRDAGLLDRTHLRFFTRSTAIELVTAGGLELVKAVDARVYGPGDAKYWLNRLGPLFVELNAKQWVLVAQKPR
jgi:2-polyprenyl-3-methyl-5-hydroxy-6-metoxy-1,4-benzoquinol methylase